MPTCRRGDRSTKLATASPSGGGLNYSPIYGRELFTSALSPLTWDRPKGGMRCPQRVGKQSPERFRGKLLVESNISRRGILRHGDWFWHRSEAGLAYSEKPIHLARVTKSEGGTQRVPTACHFPFKCYTARAARQSRALMEQGRVGPDFS
jgi:hypothetical protein